MTKKQYVDIYIASCCKHGCICHYTMGKDGEILFKDKVILDYPMYLAIEKNKLYALLRQPFQNNKESGLISFDIINDGALANPGRVVSTEGEIACHLAVENEVVYAVNYQSGSVIIIPDILVEHQGKSVHPSRQTKPYTHFVCLTPDKKYICVVDLGVDSIIIYDKNLSFISKVKVPDGHGPRHLAISKDGKTVFCANELASTVSVLDYSDGNLDLINTYNTLPADFRGESTAAAIRVKNNYLYVSNRGHDSITCFEIYGKQLEFKSVTACGGESPRDFNIVGDYLICTNETSDNVTTFTMDNGMLTKTKTELNIKRPLCIIANLI